MSLRGGAGFGFMAPVKAALRSYAQSLYNRLTGDGIHVAHVVIDGVIFSPNTKAWSEAPIMPDELADQYVGLYRQVRTTRRVRISPLLHDTSNSRAGGSRTRSSRAPSGRRSFRSPPPARRSACASREGGDAATDARAAAKQRRRTTPQPPMRSSDGICTRGIITARTTRSLPPYSPRPPRAAWRGGEDAGQRAVNE